MRKLDEILKNQRIWGYEKFFPMHAACVKLPDCGTCSVIWSDNEDGYEHVSVSPKKKFRIPTWDDMCVLKDIFFDDEEEAYQIHPKKSQYVNNVENCLHLWKPKKHELGDLKKQNSWIPVSERLPEESGYYMACIYNEDVDDYSSRKTWFAHEDDYDMDESEWRELYSYERVVAWMPLPEPYEEGEQ